MSYLSSLIRSPHFLLINDFLNFSKYFSMGLFFVHIHLPVSFHFQYTRFPHNFQFKFLTVNAIPNFCQLLLDVLLNLDIYCHARVLVLATLPRWYRTFSFVFCLSFCISRVVAQVTHILIWLIILNPPLHFSLCLAPSWNIIVLHFHKLSLMLLLDTSEFWIFFHASHISLLEMSSMSLFLLLQSVTFICIRPHSRSYPHHALVVIWHSSVRFTPCIQEIHLHSLIYDLYLYIFLTVGSDV